MPNAHNFIDLAGRRFGSIVVIERAPPKAPSESARWKCRCDCGRTLCVHGAALRRGQRTCIKCRKKVGRDNNRFTHGLSKTPEFKIWIDMRNRCSIPSSTSFPRYGAKGIKVCLEWEKSFETFYRDMGPRPSKTHSIDRVVSTGNYCPENCKWSTASEQAMNRKSTVKVIYLGQEIALRTLAKQQGLDPAWAVEAYRRYKSLDRVLAGKKW